MEEIYQNLKICMMLFWYYSNPSTELIPAPLFQTSPHSSSINNTFNLSLTIASSPVRESRVLNVSHENFIQNISILDEIQDGVEEAWGSNVSSNSTDYYELPIYIRVWATVIVVLILVVGITGNALVPLLVCKTKELRHSTNIFLLNLAAADTLVLLICLPTALVELHTLPETWILGATLCRLVPYIEVCVTRASVVTLVVISVERWVAICQPLSSPVVCTRPRAAIVCLAVWPFVLLASIPTVILTIYKEVPYYDGRMVEVCNTTVHEVPWGSTYHLLCVVVFFFIPFIFLMIIYSMIALRLLCHQTCSSRRLDTQQWRARKQVVGMLGAVVVVFFVSVLPFQLFTMWIIIVPRETIINLDLQVYYNILYVCRSLFYVNSAANPIIYNAMSSKFRKALVRLLGISISPTRRLLRRQSTLTTTTSSTLSTSSFRRRASSILIHRPIEVFNRRHSLRSLFNRRTGSTSSTSQNVSNTSSRRESEFSFRRSNETLSRRESEISSRKSSQSSSRRTSEQLKEIPIIKEDLYLVEQCANNECNAQKPPPSPLSLPSASSSHASTPPSSPLYTLINNFPNDDCSRSSSLATPETIKKVSFSETVFHWDQDENHIRIPLEEHKLHTWRTYAMFSRRAKLKSHDLPASSRSYSSFKENPNYTCYKTIQNQNSSTEVNEDKVSSSQDQNEITVL